MIQKEIQKNEPKKSKVAKSTKEIKQTAKIDTAKAEVDTAKAVK